MSRRSSHRTSWRAVAASAGSERPGQVAMADAVADARDRRAPARPGGHGHRQVARLPRARCWCGWPSSRGAGRDRHRDPGPAGQLANKDIPAALDAVEEVLGKRPRHAILKGRTNYACLLKVRDGGAEDQAALISAGDLAETIKARRWPRPSRCSGPRCWRCGSGPRSSRRRRPGRPRRRPVAHRRAWQQVSIPVRECLGPQRCPYGADCLVEESRERPGPPTWWSPTTPCWPSTRCTAARRCPSTTAVVIDEATSWSAG